MRESLDTRGRVLTMNQKEGKGEVLSTIVKTRDVFQLKLGSATFFL